MTAARHVAAERHVAEEPCTAAERRPTRSVAMTRRRATR
jgi:hypothetical protein